MAVFFHDDLAPYGRWIDHPIYGVAWVPQSGQPNWHPYWDGRWVWTTDYGWYWHSHEPYGWATYHYGRWVLTSDYGWVWVPDTVWGPAWVEWRYGGGYAGWAPMPPPQQQKKVASVETSAWIFVPQADIAKADGRQRISAEETSKVLTAAAPTPGAEIANLTRAKPETLGTAGSVAELAAAQAKGQVAVYRPPFLSGLNPAAPGGLNLDVPLDTSTEIDPEAAAKAKAQARLGDAIPDKPVSGSVDTRMGGSFGSQGPLRMPSSGSSKSGGAGVNVPSVGGIGIGR